MGKKSYLKRKIFSKLAVFLTVIMIVFWSIPCNLAFGEVQESPELPVTGDSGQPEATDITTEVTVETTEESDDETVEESADETVEESADENNEETVDEITKEGAAESETSTGETEIVSVVYEPTVSTDKDDYYPGETVIVTGSGWLPGEIVKLDFVMLSLQLDMTYYATADSEGNIYNNEYHIYDHHLGQTIVLTATGQTTFLSAVAIFTDSPRVGSVTVGAQSPNPVTAGNSATYTVTIYRGSGGGSSGGFSAGLSITTSLPDGCTYSFNPSPVSFKPNENSITTTLTISTVSATPGGTTTFTVRAEASSSDFATGNGTLVIQAANIPPTITGQPSSATKTVGESVTFSVEASGTAPLNYQWRKNGANIFGAKSSSYTIPSVAIGDAGSYDVVVSNAYGSETSNAAILTVNKITPTITWSNPDDIVYETALSATQLNATASVPGSFLFTPAAGTVLNAGSGQDLRVDFTPSDTDNYNNATKTVQINVTPISITVTADAKSKTYGEADPVLTYTSSDPGASFSGELSRDAGEDIGTYSINQGTLSAGGNYSITYIPADFVIKERAITVTADSQSKVYGEADPEFTYSITSGSLAFSDELTGELIRDTGEDTGTYQITQGTLALDSNYILTFERVDFTITQKTITVTADAKSKTYGEADPLLTYTSSDPAVSFSGELSRDAGED